MLLGFRIWMVKKLQSALFKRNKLIVYYHDKELLNTIKDVIKKCDMQLSEHEAYQLYKAVQSIKKISGGIADVGIYKGGTSELISRANPNKELYLFDTFNGLPKPGEIDELFTEGEFKSDYDSVVNFFKDRKNIKIYKGLLEETSYNIADKIFAFVHLDVDLYEGTKNCLTFFYNRMNEGGIIMSHDYTQASGVKKAFDEFFKDKPEPVIQMVGTHCMVVKL